MGIGQTKMKIKQIEIKEIRKKLEVYYKKEKYLLTIDQFILFEMALMIVKRVNPDANPSKGYIIFTKYQNIGKTNFTEDSYIMQNASICLKKYSSQKIWRDTLKEYKKKEYNGIRLFEIEEDKFFKRDTSNMVYPSREDDYIKYIISYSYLRSANYAVEGSYKYYNRNNEEKSVFVYLKEDMDKKISSKPKEVMPREKIVLTIKDLISAAEEMQKKISEDYCIDVLKKNLIKEVKDGRVELAEKIELDKVVNIVGMVGAGKTSLLKTMAYSLNKLGKRIVIVTDTIAEVFRLYKYFCKLGCNCSPFIGKSERIKYINQLIEGEAYYLEEEISKYLTTNCFIDGFDFRNENAVPFGEEPCTKLECSSRRYVCPYFDRCTATAMQREALESNIVITTAAGLVISKVGKLQNIFLKEVIEAVDVVFYDECDRVQKNLDELFTPVIEFNTFMKKCAEEFHQFAMKLNLKKIENINSAYYTELQAKSFSVLICVSNAVNAVKNSSSKNIWENTFSAYTLLESIQDEISEGMKKEIYKLMDFSLAKSSSLYHIMKSSCESVKIEYFEELLSAWIEQNEPELVLEDISQMAEKYLGKSEKELKEIEAKINQKNKKKIELYKKIRLILTLIFLDRFVAEMDNAYQEIQDITQEYNELTEFTRTQFIEQQDYLPSALMGNLFGIKSTAENNILLFRQYAYGRALLTDLPYLKVNCDGATIGPHIVLLSGSSYAKGSYKYHVNADVNYIMEADKTVRDFIAKTQFIELDLEERVSGSPLELKEEVLSKVIDGCISNIILELKKEGKILLVVNSFLQAEAVAEYLRINLKKRQCEEKVCTLVSDKSIEKDSEKKSIRRGEVYKFDQNQARILVAPALAIERGHNIVDKHGHSSLSSIFFLIRPIGVPDDIKEKSIKLNGYMAEKIYQYINTDIYEKNLYIRQEAVKFWKRINRCSKTRLDYLCDTEIKTDLVATMFVLILQIFGRLCRVTDYSKNPPTVYFVDGAFRKKEKTEEGFDTLNELYLYLQNLFLDADSKEIARTLYEPFFTAYKGGIRYE